MRRRKRKLNKRGKLLFAFLFCIILIIIGIKFISFDKVEEKKLIKKEISNDVKVIKDKDSKLSLVMVGDNLIHDKIYREARREDGYDFKGMYKFIKDKIKDYDLAYYNQETILGGSDIGVSSYPAFNSPYEVGDAMIDAGFNLVSLATNHTLDRGEKAILNSRDYWNKQSNVLAVGSYSSWDERNRVQIREVNGIKYTLLNYTYGTNGISVPNGKEYLVNVWSVSSDSEYEEYKEQVKKDIEAVRDKVDLLMVAMHWGVEYQYSPNDYQRDMAKYLESLGVDIIIGTHPHVIEPVAWINDTLVIYSLGNFMSAHEVVDMGNRIGLMSSVDVVKRDGKINIENVKNELLYTYYTSDYKDFSIIPFSMMKEEYLSNYRDVYLKYKKIVQEMDSDMEVVSIN